MNIVLEKPLIFENQMRNKSVLPLQSLNITKKLGTYYLRSVFIETLCYKLGVLQPFDMAEKASALSCASLRRPSFRYFNSPVIPLTLKHLINYFITLSKFTAEPLARGSWFHSHFDNVMTQFIINKRTDA